MSNGDTYTSALQRLDERLDRWEEKQERRDDKLDVVLQALDAKQDVTVSRLDRLEGKLEGSIGMLRWLGPVGVAALIAGLLAMYGVIPTAAGRP